MKKRIPKICINILISLAAVWTAVRRGGRIAITMAGCLLIALRYHQNKYEADDIISEAVYEAVGDKKVSYQGKQYNPASTYITLPDIKSLVVSQKIARTAEEEGIDWYEIWPDLEHYVVLED